MKKWIIGLISIGILLIIYLLGKSNLKVESEPSSILTTQNEVKNQKTFSKKKIKKNNDFTKNKPKKRVLANRNHISLDKRHIKNDIQKNSSLVVSWEKYFEEDAYEINDQNYRISNNLIAVTNGVDNTVFEMSGYQIITFNGDINTTSDARVVLNKSTKRLGVLTGNIILTLKNNISSQELKEEYGLITIRSIDHLGIVITKPQEGSSVFEIIPSLDSSDDFHEYEIEIIEGSINEK